MKQIFLKTGETAVIRRPEPDDAKAAVSYLNAVGGESDFLLFGLNEFRFTEEQEREYIEGINRKETSVMLLAVVGGAIAGIAVLSGAERKRIAHTCELAISVAKAHWGKGIGMALVEELIAFARSTGVLKVIHLSVYENNERARALYRKLGFEEIGLYRDGVRICGTSYNLVLMNLYL